MPTTAARASTHPTRIAQRLDRLMAWSGLKRPAFVKRIGLDNSMITKLLNGDRGASGEAPKLILKAGLAFGIRAEYWDVSGDPDPQEYANPQLRSLAAGRDAMGTMVGGAARRTMAEIAQFASESGESPEAVYELIRQTPPPNADPLWFIRTYLDLVAKHPRREK